MPAEFRALNGRMLLNKYREPVSFSEVRQMMLADSEYAKQASQPVFVIADFGGVKHFPPNLVTTALQLGNINPVRNSQIELILVITDSAFVANIISVIVRITGSKKIVVKRSYEDAHRVVEAYANQHKLSTDWP